MFKFFAYIIAGLLIVVVESWLSLVSINCIFKANIHISWQTILAACFVINVIIRQASIKLKKE